MNNNLMEILQKFNNICKHGWYLVPQRGYGENGLLFEKLIGLNNNELPVADYNGVEIKVQSLASSYPITLFSLSLDGPSPFELQRLVKRYGAYDKHFLNSKVMYVSLNSRTYSSWGRFIRFKLFCDIKNEKLYIIVSHSNGKTIEKKAFWSFATLKKTLFQKMPLLCIVRSISKFSNNKKYIKFSDINFYRLKSFDNFIYEICNGNIEVQIKYGIHKSGKNMGKSYNHGISFKIYDCNLLNIFEEIFLQKK